jgi:hypothetical protein
MHPDGPRFYQRARSPSDRFLLREILAPLGRFLDKAGLCGRRPYGLNSTATVVSTIVGSPFTR